MSKKILSVILAVMALFSAINCSAMTIANDPTENLFSEVNVISCQPTVGVIGVTSGGGMIGSTCHCDLCKWIRSHCTCFGHLPTCTNPWNGINTIVDVMPINPIASEWTVENSDQIGKDTDLANSIFENIGQITPDTVLSEWIAENVNQIPQDTALPEEDDASASADNTIANQVLELVNKERSANGLNKLTLDPKLCSMAQYKAEDMAAYGFSHEGSYGSLKELLAKFNIRYGAAGENIAMNQTSPEEVMRDWMGSEGHRANILGKNYNKLGVGCYESDGNIYWVQEFTD